MASTSYDDVYMRDNLRDTGAIPSIGTWYISPDIIPNGTSVMENPVTTLTDSYNQDIGQETVLNQQNYFYVRGKNLYPGARTAKFELYYCPSNLFLFPSVWETTQLKTSAGETQVSATVSAQGDIVVPTNAFTFNPKSDIHHCLIGRVITDTHPNPLPASGSIANMEALAKFIMDHPSFAWRNVVLVRKDVPTFTHQFDLQIGDRGGQLFLGIKCNNITVGSSVAFSSGDSIPSGPNEGRKIYLPETKITLPDEVIGSMYYLPPGFRTTISYSYWAKPPIQPGWEVKFMGNPILDQEHSLFQHAQPLTELVESKNLYSSDGEHLVYGRNHSEDSKLRLYSEDEIPYGLKLGACITRGI